MRSPGSIVLSEDAATRLFGDARRAIGRTLRLSGEREVSVVGVIGAIPQPARMSTDPGANNQTRVDALVSMDVFENSERGKALTAAWNSTFCSTFARLPTDGSLPLDALRERLASFGERHVPKGDWKSAFGAVPLSQYRSLQLDSVVGTGKTGISGLTVLYTLGGLVLLVSCINTPTSHPRRRARASGKLVCGASLVRGERS